jgi:hypothetical protein
VEYQQFVEYEFYRCGLQQTAMSDQTTCIHWIELRVTSIASDRCCAARGALLPASVGEIDDR